MRRRRKRGTFGRVNGSFGHCIQKISEDKYRISWKVDNKFAASEYKHIRLITKNTDLAGAQKFAKKWKLEFVEGVATFLDPNSAG